MTAKNRKFEMTMHGRIRKTPVRKCNADEKQKEPQLSAVPGIPGLTPEMLETLMRMFENNRNQQRDGQALPVYPQFPQPMNPYFPSPYQYPDTIQPVWTGDNTDPNAGIVYMNQPLSSIISVAGGGIGAVAGRMVANGVGALASPGESMTGSIGSSNGSFSYTALNINDHIVQNSGVQTVGFLQHSK